MSWFTAKEAAREEASPYLEANSIDETPARAITKLALSRQVDALNASERPPALARGRQGRALTRRDATRLKANAAGYSGDSEADMLSGISRKHRMRSGFC